MSVIVYGPQGCGKTLAAPLLMRFFGLDILWEVGNPPPARLPYTTAVRSLPVLDDSRLYEWIAQHPVEFKSHSVLFITNYAPPAGFEKCRRIARFEDAIAAALEHSLRAYLTNWPHARAMQGITARTLLEVVGLPSPLHTVPRFKQVNQVMSKLGWIRVRLRSPGQPVTWAYRPRPTPFREKFAEAIRTAAGIAA